MIMFIMFFGVLLTLFIGVTTAGSMAFISIATYFGMGEANLSNMVRLPSSMYDQVKGITLMAIPFFLLMGNFMNKGGVSKDLFAFARACLGHRWGGLSNAAIASCMIMSAMSGSAAAVAAGVGMIAIAEMRRTGYDSICIAGSRNLSKRPVLRRCHPRNFNRTAFYSLFKLRSKTLQLR